VLGESAVSAAPSFENAGRPSESFWGQQQGNKLVLWESLKEGEKDSEGSISENPTKRNRLDNGGRPIRVKGTKLSKRFESIADTSSRVNARSSRVKAKAEKRHQGKNLWQEHEGGGDRDKCPHALLMPKWNARHITNLPGRGHSKPASERRMGTRDEQR
jgi:hypothetical protein